MAVTYYAGCDLALAVTLTDQNANPINLTGATVTLKMLDPGGFQRILSPTVTSATAGQISQQLTAAQLATAGEYQFQVVIVENGLTSASNQFSLTLSEQLF